MTSRRKSPTSEDSPKKSSSEELEALFETKGSAAIRTLRTCDPGAYLRAIAALVRDCN